MGDATCYGSDPWYPAADATISNLFIGDPAAAVTTGRPTRDPTAEPTAEPTPAPSSEPTEVPTQFHCETRGCDERMVCDQATGQCIRDCDTLHIDAFLTECSAEWDENNNTLAAMSESIGDNAADITTVTATATTNTADIAAVTATAASNTAGIATNAADFSVISTNMTALEAKIEALELAVAKLTVFSAHSQSGNLDVGPSGITMTDLVGGGMWSIKDVVIIGLVVFNVILVIMACAIGLGRSCRVKEMNGYY